MNLVVGLIILDGNCFFVDWFCWGGFLVLSEICLVDWLIFSGNFLLDWLILMGILGWLVGRFCRLIPIKNEFLYGRYFLIEGFRMVVVLIILFCRYIDLMRNCYF